MNVITWVLWWLIVVVGSGSSPVRLGELCELGRTFMGIVKTGV